MGVEGMSADNRDLYDPEGFYFDDEVKVKERRHRIKTDHDSNGMYWAWCDCNWYTLPAYDSGSDAKAAGQDHLDAVRS
jgi:hypothetical protein